MNNASFTPYPKEVVLPNLFSEISIPKEIRMDKQQHAGWLYL